MPTNDEHKIIIELTKSNRSGRVHIVIRDNTDDAAANKVWQQDLGITAATIVAKDQIEKIIGPIQVTFKTHMMPQYVHRFFGGRVYMTKIAGGYQFTGDNHQIEFVMVKHADRARRTLTLDIKKRLKKDKKKS